MTSNRQMRRARDDISLPDGHFVAMRQIRDAQIETNAHVRAAADSIKELASKLDAFVAAVATLQATVASHAEDIQEIRQREETREQRAAEHRFILGNNVVFWLIGGLSVAFGLINVINFIGQHWK